VAHVYARYRPGRRSRFSNLFPRCYLLCTKKLCDITPLLFLVSSELFCTWVGNGATPGCIGVPAPLFGLLALAAVTLAQELSYCEGAPALLYAAPPLPPLMLVVGAPLLTGSLCVEPGDVAELPGALVALFVLMGPAEFPHALLGPPLLAYAGAAPITAMATMQLAESSLCLIFTLRFWVRRGAHPSGYTMSMGIWFK
jgi:hypothetical protein